jgi:hypothetical protein
VLGVGPDDTVLELPHRLLEETLGEGIDRHYPPHVNRGQLVVPDRLELGVVEHDPAVLGERLLPVEDHSLVPLELLGEIGAPEPESREVARLVPEGHLEGTPGAVAWGRHAEDRSLHHARGAERELVEGHELPSVLIVPGEVVQRVPDRHQAEPLQLTGALGPHALEVLEGAVEAGGSLGHLAHGQESLAGRVRCQACLTSSPMV